MSQNSQCKNTKLNEFMNLNNRTSYQSQNDSQSQGGFAPSTSLSALMERSPTLKDRSNKPSVNQSLLKDSVILSRVDALDEKIQALETSTAKGIKEIADSIQKLSNSLDEKAKLDQVLFATLEQKSKYSKILAHYFSTW